MAIGHKEIVQAIFEGTKSAAIAYDLLSGHWLDYAPESFLQANIALAFSKRTESNSFKLTLEASHTKINWEYPLKRDGRSIKMTTRQRFDLLIWLSSQTPSIPIEIKKTYRARDCLNDAERIRRWVRARHSPMKRGYVVVYTSADAPNAHGKIRKLFDEIASLIDADDHESLFKKASGAPEYAWDVACFTIT